MKPPAAEASVDTLESLRAEVVALDQARRNAPAAPVLDVTSLAIRLSVDPKRLTNLIPRLLPGVEGHLIPEPDGSRWIGAWWWLIAGRQVISTFAVEADSTPEEIEARAVAAHERLYAYVEERLAFGTHGSVGVVPEAGDLPRP